MAKMKKSLHSPRHKALLDLLREMREKSGLRQEEVAKKLGKPQSFVSKYESGERRLDVLELREICRVLGIPILSFVRKLETRLSVLD
jgi:transcriptional regulator with XRE-family HTH domain